MGRRRGIGLIEMGTKGFLGDEGRENTYEAVTVESGYH
jgi:hypothetical protein